MSVAGGPALTKIGAGGWGGTSLFQKKKCQSEGESGLTFPNVKNDAGASTYNIVRVFEGVAGLQLATISPKKKKHGQCCIVLDPASFLTFAKVNPSSPQTDIFGGREGFKTQPYFYRELPHNNLWSSSLENLESFLGPWSQWCLSGIASLGKFPPV